jgi:hypothetical protein
MLAGTQLILVAPLGWREEAARLACAGFAGAPPKPIRTRNLRRVLAAVLGQTRSPADTQHDPGTIALPSLPPSRFQGRIVVVVDNPTDQTVAVAMLRRSGGQVDTVGNGLEAVDALRQIPYGLVLMACQRIAQLRQGIAAGDAKGTHREAHGVKGAAATVTTARLGACAAELQGLARTPGLNPDRPQCRSVVGVGSGGCSHRPAGGCAAASADCVRE